MITCGLFDSLGHADSLLRGGVNENLMCEGFQTLIPLMKETGISYELNASGLRKPLYEIETGRKLKRRWSFPSREFVPQLVSEGISLTIGSDAHKPEEVGSGIKEVIRTFGDDILNNLCHYEKRRRIHTK